MPRWLIGPSAASPTSRSGFALVVVAALGWAAPAGATVMLSLTTEQLTDQASVVVRGRVVGQQVVTDAGRLWTDTTLRIGAVLKGTVSAGKTIVVRQPGGDTPMGGMVVAGAARFGRGEEVLVFLRPASGSLHVAVGMCQGKYRVYRDAGGVERARRELGGVAFALRDGQGRVSLKRAPSADVPLAMVVSAVQRRTAPGGWSRPPSDYRSSARGRR